ncbi:hypothetical protein BCR37DRAFT_406077 [Protomyces lactucae-debilis]|uniref:NAD(P)-binding protein n=1 Tax=Protomyces lactucae-debilis TaxID=2754530 RepID=A0A1Y2EYN2_PROLT|nr:uncharacterized protein BCR37DRAFT_406077 [Protomyces lactucae-debilis]ORY76587.1 hypothetical protein BCR37DRAFT_406077 [Protomyces lactucae-debilis]
MGLLYPLIYGYKFTTSKMPSQTGKVVIVTGANTGIGYETALENALRGAKVYIGARSEARAQKAISRIRARNPSGTVEWLKLDLQDLSSVQAAAKAFSDKEGRLDVLYNNAGIMAVPYELTKDGIESQFQTNHLGPFLFTNLLLPKLQNSKDPRIVVTASAAHITFTATKESYSSLEAVNGDLGSTIARYGQSKLANILFAMELADRFPNIKSNACHPGIINSDLNRGIGASYGKVAQVVTEATVWFNASVLGTLLSSPQGALTQLYLGTSEEIRSQGISGRYFQPIAQETKPSASATKDQAVKLWKTSEEILRQKGFKLTL